MTTDTRNAIDLIEHQDTARPRTSTSYRPSNHEVMLMAGETRRTVETPKRQDEQVVGVGALKS